MNHPVDTRDAVHLHASLVLHPRLRTNFHDVFVILLSRVYVAIVVVVIFIVVVL